MKIDNRQFRSLSAALNALVEWRLDNVDEAQGCFLIQVFATLTLVEAQQLAQGLKARFPHSSVLGMSTHNGLLDACHVEAPVIISLCFLQQTQLRSGWRAISPDNCQQQADALFSELDSPDNRVVISFADGINGSHQQLFGNFPEQRGYAPIVGGIVDHSREAKGPWVMIDEYCAPNIIAAIALNSKTIKVWQSAFLEWMPVGRRMLVTRAKGRRLYQVNGENIADAYARYLSVDGQCLFEIFQDFPLVWRHGDHESYSAPVKLYDDGSMEMTEPLPIGAQLQFSYFHPNLSKHRIRQKLYFTHKELPQAVFLYNCASRIFNDDGCIEEELEVFQELAPSVGCYCFGEFAAAPKQRIAHHSVTYLALSESQQALPLPPRKPLPSSSIDRNLSPVFTLINQAFADLDRQNTYLESEIELQSQALLASTRQHRLSRLPNREQLASRLSEHRHLSALAVIKLCNLGWLNHGLGDALGDQAVIWLAQQLQQQSQQLWPQGAELFHISGSEWLLAICQPCEQGMLTEQLFTLLTELEGQRCSLQVRDKLASAHLVLKAGVVFCPDGCVPAVEVKLNRLVHKAKQARRQAVNHNLLLALYQEDDRLSTDPVAALSVMDRVKRALADQQVVVFGQPIVAAGSRELAAIECLVRIRTDEGYLLPGEFLPTLMKTNLYGQLSREVIRQGISLLGDYPVKFSINLAPQDLYNDTTYSHLVSAIRGARYPQLIGLEIVETEQIADYSIFAVRLAELRALGIRLLIDDFGSGYSNLNEILDLSPDVVKFDGSLVRDMDTNARQRLMVEHLNNLCQSMNIRTTAEFVRNREICELVESIGVNYLQGFYLAEPQPLGDIIRDYLQTP